MGDRDFYPSSMDAKAAWHVNYVKNLAGAMATKYGISAAILTSATADRDWMVYWVEARHAADAMSQQLTRYFNTIAGKNDSADAPAPISWELPEAPPEVPPGIEKRVKDQARDIKGSMVYAPADGILLGIQLADSVGGESPSDSPDFAPVIEFATMPEFKLQARFRKLGMDGVRFEYKRAADTNWQPAGVLLVSPGTFTISPTEPGVGEQVQVRAIYFKGNADVGTFSPTYSPFIGA